MSTTLEHHNSENVTLKQFDSSGPHRYLFLLFREPHPLDLKKEDIGGEEFVQRRSFKPAEVAGRLGLKLVGVNWMKCVADDWKE